MPREKETYRLILAELREHFPGRNAVTIPEAAEYLGVKYDRLKADATFPRVTIGKQQVMLLAALAHRLTL